MTDSKAPVALKTLDDLTKLADWLKASGLDEIELEIGESRIRLRRNGVATAPFAGAMLAPATAAAVEAAPVASPKANANVFKAPMVGTYYEAASPESAAFVKVGDTVKEGQVLCIIEAMKTMNQIESDRAGVVKAILVKNASPVEFGQPMFEIA